MKILVVPSGFKGTVLSKEVCQAISKGLKKAKTELVITEMPIADGGLGTAEILTKHFKGKLITCWVSGPLGKKVKARYGIVPSKKLAIIELAQAAGLHLVPPKSKNPLRNTTSGVGELIVNSLKRCCKRIMLGVGDSATIDCGIGAMSSLGVKFLDKNLRQVDLNCLGLLNLNKIDTTKVMKELRSVEFTILTDVGNRLTGKNGAIVYAPQKGAKDSDLYLIDQALKNFKKIVLRNYGVNPDKIKGAGAAGGIAGGMATILRAKLVPGFDFFEKVANLKNEIKNSDLIITGEGMIDKTTFYGKATGQIISICRANRKRIILICGDYSRDLNLDKYGIIKAYSLTEMAKSRNGAMNNARQLLHKIGIEIGRIIYEKRILENQDEDVDKI